ncbi:MAG: hypothetical protein LBD71_03440 [Treponema sp.]|jgi:hypothetical protein|nr:hypothetical protein [Treponema sp.]
MGKRRILLWFFLLPVFLRLPFFAFAESRGIETNAREGFFPRNQKLWFSVPAGDRLRVLLDGAETDASASIDPAASTDPAASASLDLNAAYGEERSFLVTAERYSPRPENRLLETRTFSITVDKKPPGDFRENGLTIAALADFGNEPVFFPDISSAFLPPVPFNAVVWAIDPAGNASAPVPFSFDFPLCRIENPVPGVWANAQRLVISGAEGRKIFWTDDGTDPLGPGGELYRGPVLIDRTGEVTLRIASPDGLSDGEVAYRVEPAGAGDGERDKILAALRSLEEKEFREAAALPVPAGFRWSMGGTPDQIPGEIFRPAYASAPQAARGPVLRPLQKIRRTAALHLGENGGAGIWRFVFTLDGSGAFAPVRPPFAPKGERVPEYINREDGDLIPSGEAGGPRLVYNGRSRVVVWKTGAVVRCVLDGPENGSSWLDGARPVPVSAEGGRLKWIIEENGGIRGPFFLDIEALPRVSFPFSGSYAFRHRSSRNTLQPVSGRWKTASLPYDTEAGFSELPLDASDGEDVEWCFLTENGPRQVRRTDRLAPLPPELSVTGEWRGGPLIVQGGVKDEDPSSQVRITARVFYESGAAETKTGTGSVSVVSKKEYAEAAVEAFLEDPAGNRSPRSELRFVFDPLSVYRSDAGTGKETGGRDAPFRSLERALEFCRREGRKRLFMNGSFQLGESAVIAGDIVIDGSFDADWNRGGSSSITMMKDVSFTVRDGSLVLRGLALERREGETPLFTARNSRLEIEKSAVIHTGPLVDSAGGSCVLNEVRARSLFAGETRISGIRINGGGLVIAKSVFGMEGVHSLFLEMKEGDLAVRDSEFTLEGGRTGTLFSLEKVRGNLSGLSAGLRAADYCAGLDLDSSALIMEGGSISVSARDALAVLSDHSECLFQKTIFNINAAFVARAMNISGNFPRVAECGFVFSGSAKRAEVFQAETYPEEGTIASNAFRSFTHILGDAYPEGSIAGFNRRFAPPSRPNAVTGPSRDMRN